MKRSEEQVCKISRKLNVSMARSGLEFLMDCRAPGVLVHPGVTPAELCNLDVHHDQCY